MYIYVYGFPVQIIFVFCYQQTTDIYKKYDYLSLLYQIETKFAYNLTGVKKLDYLS
jgi:hypothetical protein